MTSLRRALHFVFKVGDRKETARFFKDVLGMTFLRHEEFQEGCKASCNGPYDGKWSKSMVGYGSEDTNFVVELTYNYGIGSYEMGNDFQGITINDLSVVENAKKNNWPFIHEEGRYVLEAPGGYKFIVPETTDNSLDLVQKVTLASSNLQKSLDFWNGKLGMQIFSQEDKTAVLGFSDKQARLELIDIGQPVDHAKAFGRIAFSCPREQLPGIEKSLIDSGDTILTPLVALDTPGKATVEVVIVADPDGHEICFVGDEAFRELSQTDPKADDLLVEALDADKSNEWFAKKGLAKASL